MKRLLLALVMVSGFAIADEYLTISTSLEFIRLKKGKIMSMKKYFFGIIFSVMLLISSSNGNNQLEVQTHYMLNTWEGSSSQSFDAEGSGFLIAFNYGSEYGSFLETFYYYASANEGAVSSPVNQTLSVDLESRATGMYLGVGYRQKLINKLDYTISGGVGSQTIDIYGFEVGGNPTVDDSKNF